MSHACSEIESVIRQVRVNLRDVLRQARGQKGHLLLTPMFSGHIWQSCCNEHFFLFLAWLQVRGRLGEVIDGG